MSYSPLRLAAEEGSYIPHETAASSPKRSLPSPRRQMSNSHSYETPQLQLRFDRLSLKLDRPLQAAGESGVDSVLSLVRSMDSGTSYEMIGSESDSDDDVHHRKSGKIGTARHADSGSEYSEDEEDEDYRPGPEPAARTPMSDSGVLVSNPSSNGAGGPTDVISPSTLKTPDVLSPSSVYSSFSSSSPARHREPDPAAMGHDARQLGGSADPRNSVSVDAGDLRTADVYDRDSSAGSAYDTSAKSPVSYQLETAIPSSSFLDASDPAFAYTTSEEEVDHRYQHSSPHLPPPPSSGGSYDDRSRHNHEEQRPATSASAGTGDPFKDFDGVHFNPDPPPQPPHHRPQRSSSSFPRPVSYAHPPSPNSQGSQGLIYYPAPVPAMLNLPPLMSKPRNSNSDNRNLRIMESNRMSQHIPSVSVDKSNRRSLAYPPPAAAALDKDKRQSVGSIDQLNRRSLQNLPPALRASHYFDSRTPQLTPEVKEGSAMATLDSILDASARAPVNAFTDHPMASSSSHGRSASSSNTIPKNSYRNSTAIMVKRHPGESPRSSLDDDERQHLTPEIEGNSNRYSAASAESLQPRPASPEAPPTTLLAELESRKKQQRMRNRTATNAPNGIRSTLLELDAVAQIQKEQRRLKKTTLAWEDPEMAGREEDEDVPLGVLYGRGQMRRNDEDVPLGLLVRKEIEDSEPLSRRRERLRAVAQPVPRRFLDVKGLEKADDEEETLAQRIKRLKEKEKRRSNATFGDGSLGLSFEKDGVDDPEEETLAQRRRRLQKEGEAGSKTMGQGRSMTSLNAQLRPRGFVGGSEQRPHTGGGVMPMMGNGMSGMSGMQMGMGGMPMAGQMGMGGGQMGMDEVGLDARQREIVERWRASVM